MAEVFLDSSVLIGMIFRHAGERLACRRVISDDKVPVSSRYVIFEVARGFLRSLIALHNYSFEFDSFADLHQAAHSGQQRFKPYRMSTWLGAFDDYFSALEQRDGGTSEALKLEEFRAKLRGWIRRGWRSMQTDFTLVNRLRCREDLPPPVSRGDERLDQRLPVEECGQPAACGLQDFVYSRKVQVEAVAGGLETNFNYLRDEETLRRIAGLRHLIHVPPGENFQGKRCHECGDALICLESPLGMVIATKNAKHFEPIAGIPGKSLIISETARKTR